MKKIIFLQSKLPDDPNALRQISNRWNLYGELLQKQGSVTGIWVVTPRPLGELGSNIFQSKFINQFSSVERKKSVISRINALRHEIRSQKEGVILVCGDNQQSLLFALALKIVLSSCIKIQIQFHGNTYSFRYNQGFQGFIRVCLSRLGIFVADSIRIVSQFQMDEIRDISESAVDKLVLAPIPIDFSRVSENPKDLIYDIAFIGRLHTERGITELIEIINLIKNRRPSTTIVIVGDGPLKGEIEVELDKWLEDSSISMRGFLPADEILDIYASTKILISTAPHEGYGLTLREAALSNLYVVARESKGALETKLIFPSRIDTFSDSDEAVRLICDGLNNPNFAGSTDAFAAQLASDNQGLQRLAKSWVDL